MIGTHSTRRWWIIAGLLGVVILGAVLVYLNWYECVRVCVYDRPLRYDVPFHRDVTDVDRIVVYWSDGIDRPTGSRSSLFEVTDPAEVAEVLAHIEFEPRTTDNAYLEACMCFGGTGIDFYRGKTRIARTVLKHGKSLRWKGFSTTRVLGFRIGYGDGPLTDESREWIIAWLRGHGVQNEEWPDEGDEVKEDDSGRGRAAEGSSVQDTDSAEVGGAPSDKTQRDIN